MKSYTTLEQSHKLAEILSTESADMKYPYFGNGLYGEIARVGEPIEFSGGEDIPCWSLAVLLDILDKAAYFMNEDASVHLSSYKTINWTVRINNSDLEPITEVDPIDACVKIIIKLHELNLL